MAAHLAEFCDRSFVAAFRRARLTVVATLLASSVCVLAAEGTDAGGEAEPLEEAFESELDRRITVGQAAILGVVEGLTEYLPVSSTGHLILTSHFLGLSRFEKAEDGLQLRKVRGLDAFEIVIQVGAILAVLGLSHKHVRRILLGLLGRDPGGLRLLGLLLTAFLPAAVIGILFRAPIKAFLFSPHTVAVALALGGVLMIAVERGWYGRQPRESRETDLFRLTFRGALIIGLMQCLALCPGMSRSMVTILGGVLVGLNMVAAAEFSFLLALPTLGGATLYEGLSELEALVSGVGPGALFVGIAVSWVVAALTVAGLVKWLTRHGLVPFGVYRLIVAAVVLIVLIV